jgi:hypothetical protein
MYFLRQILFKNTFYRKIRLIYLSSNTLIHILMVSLIAPVQISTQILIGIGYTIIVLILFRRNLLLAHQVRVLLSNKIQSNLLFNMFLDVIQILGNLYAVCFKIGKKCCRKQNKETSFLQKSNNRFSITVKRNV